MEQTQGANGTSVFTHFHLHFLVQNWKMWIAKIAQSCSQQSSFTPVFCACMCTRACACVQTTCQLETHWWSSPESGMYPYKNIFTRHVGIMLPVICLKSSLSPPPPRPETPCPAACHAGQENNLFWAGRSPASQEEQGQAQGKKQAWEFSDVGSVCLKPPPELVLNLSFLYLTLRNFDQLIQSSIK